MRRRDRENLATLSLPGLSAQRMRGIRRINISGKSGDAVFARPLRATDERYPSDQYLESESAGRKITLKQDEDNTITFIYKKADSEGGGILPDSEQEEIMPDTGDVTKAHWAILIMTAALCLIIGPAAVRIHAFRA